MYLASMCLASMYLTRTCLSGKFLSGKYMLVRLMLGHLKEHLLTQVLKHVPGRHVCGIVLEQGPKYMHQNRLHEP